MIYIKTNMIVETWFRILFVFYSVKKIVYQKMVSIHCRTTLSEVKYKLTVVVVFIERKHTIQTLEVV